MSGGSPEQDRDRVQELLRQGEELLWIGRPDPAVRLSPADVFLIPFTVAWCGFAIFWDVTAIRSGAPPFFAAWGMMFVVVGLFVVAGRFAVKSRRKRRTVYAVTDRRAIIVNGSTVTEQRLTGAGLAMTRQRRRGHLTVIFGAGRPSFQAFLSYGNTGMDGLFGFGSAVAFYDVADEAGLETALDQVPWDGAAAR